MALRRQISLLFFIGIFAAGSTALGYYYYFVYEPPLRAAERFMNDMEAKNLNGLYNDVVVSVGLESGTLRAPEESDIRSLLADHFQRGRIVDEHTREGASRDFYYLVYREPDGRVYALMAAPYKGRYRIVIPEVPMSRRHRYLWDYTWTN